MQQSQEKLLNSIECTPPPISNIGGEMPHLLEYVHGTYEQFILCFININEYI